MRNTFVGLAFATGMFCVVALAQNAQPPAQPRQPQQPQAQPQRPQAQPGQQVLPGQPGQPGQQRGQLTQPGGQTSSADQQIAALIFACCHNEVEIAKFAQSKLQSPDARAFAEKLVSDHTPDCESYQRWAGKLAADTALRAEGEEQRPGQPGAEGAATARAGGGPDWPKIHQQIAQQCLQSTKQELGRHQGAEFDKCFIGQQFAAHMALQDELKVLRNHVSPELKQQIDKSLQVVQDHQKEARQLMEQLRDSPSERVSRRPEDTKK